MAKDKKYKFKQIIIEKTDDAYSMKDELRELGVVYKYDSKTYRNSDELSIEKYAEVLKLCHTYNLIYSEDQIEISGEKLIAKKIYELLTLNENEFLIKYKSNGQTILYINFLTKESSCEANITDLKHKKFICITFNPKTNNYLYELLLYISELEPSKVDFEITKFELVLSILIEDQIERHTKQNVLNNFMRKVFAEIKALNKDNFLCNCVPGFNPEDKFYVKGSRIIRGVDGNFINYEQQFKILEYLHKKNNQKYIGVHKEANLYELFVNRKIIATVNGYTSKYIILKATNVFDKIKITLSDGNKEFPVNTLFKKEELFEKVKAAR